MDKTELSENPLLSDWSGAFALPPFYRLRPYHFLPAIEHTLREARTSYRAIAEDSATPSFDNTILAMQRIDLKVARPLSVFFNLAAAYTNPHLQEVERKVSPTLSKFHSETLTDPRLFARIDTLNNAREKLDLSAEQHRVVFLIHRMFIRAGAKLSDSQRTRMSEIMTELASLGTSFEQNVLAEEQEWALPLTNEQDIGGLPESLLDAARLSCPRKTGPHCA